MAHLVEVSDSGTLTLPAEMLGGAKPHARFEVTARREGLLLQPESPPANSTDDTDRWMVHWDRLSEAVTSAWEGETDAIETVSEMRR